MKLVSCNNMQNNYFLAEQLKLSALVFEESLEGIMITDANNNILQINDAFTQMTGYKAEEVVGAQANVLKSDVNDDAFYYSMWKKLNERGQWRGEIWNRIKDSSSIACFLSIKVLYDEEGKVKNYIAMYLDITEKKQTQDEMYYLAYHDTLTKLPNRTQFNQYITNLMNHYDRDKKDFAVLFLDLDNFKYVNDSFGHNIGDILLINVAKIFTKFLRKEDFVARLGGDEFTIVVDDYQSLQHIQVLCKRIIKSLSKEFNIKGNKFTIGCSIGIAIYPKDGLSRNTLIKNADTAMYKSKHNGKNRFTFHTEEMNEELYRKVQLDNGIKDALHFNEFEMYYQPKIKIDDNTVIGAEALIRWNSPVLGMIPPSEFIPYAEESGLIKKIGKYILKNVFQSISLIQESYSSLVISINISSEQFQETDFIEHIISLLEVNNINPKMIEFEITETKIMDNIEENIKKLLILKELGITVSIDDFGTGYSSMSYLQKLPVDIIKIDKSFIDGIHISEDSKVLVKAMISLSKALNLKTVAEGVELEKQKEFLQELGCDYIQGYLYSKPLSFDDFLDFIDTKKI